MSEAKVSDNNDKMLEQYAKAGSHEPTRVANLRAHAEKFPDCTECKRRIETGNYAGPGHEPSSRCRSGKRVHCSCSICF